MTWFLLSTVNGLNFLEKKGLLNYNQPKPINELGLVRSSVNFITFVPDKFDQPS